MREVDCRARASASLSKAQPPLTLDPIPGKGLLSPPPNPVYRGINLGLTRKQSLQTAHYDAKKEALV